MTKKIINVGTTPNDRSGDSLRSAFTKINDNFTELYTAVNADVQIPSQSGNNGKYLTTDGTTLSWATVSSGTTLPNQSGNNGKYLTTDGSGNLSWGTVSSGITASSSDTLTNKTINIQFGQGNTFQIQGNDITSYAGSGSTIMLNSMPTAYGLNVGNSGLTVDGGTGNYYWKPTFADGTGTIHKAGIYKSNPDTDNALYTFGANGSGTMSVVVEGSVFIGTSLPSNNGGLSTNYGGWLVVQAGGKFGGDIDTTGRLGFSTDATGYIAFASGKIFKVVSAPTHSYGASGDLQGHVAFDGDYIYYCKQTYVDNSTNIWVRVAWTGTTW